MLHFDRYRNAPGYSIGSKGEMRFVALVAVVAVVAVVADVADVADVVRIFL